MLSSRLARICVNSSAKYILKEVFGRQIKRYLYSFTGLPSKCEQQRQEKHGEVCAYLQTTAPAATCKPSPVAELIPISQASILRK